jgi:parallel beta-helix repeat protein
MTYTFKLSRRLAVSRSAGMLALLVTLSAACVDHQPLDNSDAQASPWGGQAQIKVVPRFVYAEVNQPIQLQARARVATRDILALEVEWTTSGGNMTADGVFSASTPGEYKIVGRGRGRQKGDTSTVVVGDSVPDVVAIVLAPDTASLKPDQTRHFDAEGELSGGGLQPVGAVWTATGGTIDAGGNYVAGTLAGRYRVVATNVSGTLADTASVVISSSATTPVSLQLSPASVTLVAGDSQQFSVAMRLSDSSTAATDAQFTATGGTVSSAGLFTASSSPGTYRVIATSGSLSDTAAVIVVPTATGPVIEPGTNIQAAVDANPPGTAFLLKAGTHRLQRTEPKDGDSFTGEPGTILSGARLLTTFTRSGSYWVIGGQTQQGKVHGTCATGFEGCAYPEDLFVDDVLLRHVTSLAEVTPQTWYFDYAADKIYLGTDPTGHRVETSVLPDAFYGSASSVAIKGLVVEKYASPAQHGAIHGDYSRGWTVQGNELRWNHGGGLRTGPGMQVVGNNVHHNGQLGMGGTGSGLLIEGNEIAYNNTVGYKVGWEAGGTKFVNTDGLVVRRNNVHHNWGNGLWTDINNIHSLIEDNVVVSNTYQGIFHEISYDAIIRNNTVEANGFGHQGWLFGSGILVAASPNVEIYGNTVRNNFNGITAIQQARGTGTYGPHEISNLFVHDNVVTMPSGKTGLAQDIGDNTYFTSRNNRWANNTYYLGAGARFEWLNGTISDVQWRGYGQDVKGIFHK